MAETTNKHHQPEPDNSAHVSHERSDIDIFQVVGYGAGMVAACLVVVVLMWGLFRYLGHREDGANNPNPPAMVKQRQQLPPEPRLSGVHEGTNAPPVLPHVELEELRASEDAILDSYGWVDAAKGTARVPVAVAIDMVAQKGLASKPSPAGANGGFRSIPSDASSGRTLEKIGQ